MHSTGTSCACTTSRWSTWPTAESPVRGAAALARTRLARCLRPLHPGGSRTAADRAHRRMGAARGLPPAAPVARRRPARAVGWSTSRPASWPRPPSRPRCSPPRLSTAWAGQRAGTGTHRERAAGRPGPPRRATAPPARRWRRLSIDDFGTGYSSLSLPAAAADRPHQDRPLPFIRGDRQHRRRLDRRRADRHGPRHRPTRAGRRVETDGQHGFLARPRLRRGAGATSSARRCRPTRWRHGWSARQPARALPAETSRRRCPRPTETSSALWAAGAGGQRHRRPIGLALEVAEGREQPRAHADQQREGPFPVGRQLRSARCWCASRRPTRAAAR